MQTIKQFTSHGLTIRIVPDEDVEPPHDVIEIYYLKQSRHILGNRGVFRDEMDQMFKRVNSGELYGLPVYAYVHGGVALSSKPFSCPWDSGLSGIAVASKDDFSSEEEAHNAIRQFLETYTSYLNGGACGYIIEDEDGNRLDSCWGYYTRQDCEEQAIEAAKLIAENSDRHVMI